MLRSKSVKLSLLGLAAMLLALTIGLSGDSAVAQGEPTPIHVETAVVGQLTAAAPTTVYSFYAAESTRMAVIFDVIAGDMVPALVVLDQDQQTLLAGSSGPNNNGVVVNFPGPGQYYLGLSADAGTAATFRLFIDADPDLPTNAFVLQSYLVAGVSTVCADNTPVAGFSTNEDLNTCFVLELVQEPMDLKIEWWSPSGEIVAEEGSSIDSSFNGLPLLSGIVFQGEPFETGWWQAHILLNGELSHIQWVPVQ